MTLEQLQFNLDKFDELVFPTEAIDRMKWDILEKFVQEHFYADDYEIKREED